MQNMKFIVQNVVIMNGERILDKKGRLIHEVFDNGIYKKIQIRI